MKLNSSSNTYQRATGKGEKWFIQPWNENDIGFFLITTAISLYTQVQILYNVQNIPILTLCICSQLRDSIIVFSICNFKYFLNHFYVFGMVSIKTHKNVRIVSQFSVMAWENYDAITIKMYDKCHYLNGNF